jgi:hypothetical protein
MPYCTTRPAVPPRRSRLDVLVSGREEVRGDA